MQRRTCCGLLVVVSLVCVGAAAADELDAVRRQIVRHWQKHRSMRARLTLSEETAAQGNKAVTEGSGTLEFVRKGPTVRYRRELSSTMLVEAGGQKMKFTSSLLEVFDGSYTYTLTEQVGLKTATKDKPNPRAVANVPAFLEHLAETGELKLLEEDSVEGHDAYVIAARPKRGRRGPEVVYYFSKADGVLLRQVVRRPDGEPGQVITYSDFEFDVEIDPQRFRFEPPPGVIVRDRTRD